MKSPSTTMTLRITAVLAAALLVWMLGQNVFKPRDPELEPSFFVPRNQTHHITPAMKTISQQYSNTRSFTLTQTAVFDFEKGEDPFKTSVSLSGGFLAIGTPWSADSRGKVEVWSSTSSNRANWEKRATLEAWNDEPNSLRFGSQVAISEDGSVLAIVASGELPPENKQDGLNGTLFTYSYDPEKKSYALIKFDQKNGKQTLLQGSCLSMDLSRDGTRLLVEDNFHDTLRHYVYQLSATSTDSPKMVWRQMGRIPFVPSGHPLRCKDPSSKAIGISSDGDRVVTLGKGVWQWYGAEWSRRGRTFPCANRNIGYFGSLSLGESRMKVPRVACGSGYVYELEGSSSWNQLGTANNDKTRGWTLVEGSDFAVGVGHASGVYQFLDGDWRLRAKIPGYTVSVSKDPRIDKVFQFAASSDSTVKVYRVEYG